MPDERSTMPNPDLYQTVGELEGRVNANERDIARLESRVGRIDDTVSAILQDAKANAVKVAFIIGALLFLADVAKSLIKF